MLGPLCRYNMHKSHPQSSKFGRNFRQAKFALTNLTIRQNRHLLQTECALTTLTKIRQNRQLHLTHDVICINIASLTKFRQVYHFRYCLHF